MKFLFSSLLLLLQITLFSQSWFQNDDQWTYNVDGGIGGYEGILDMTVGTDTIILGKEVKTLNFHGIGSDNWQTNGEYEYKRFAYEEDEKVYTYNKSTQSFQLNYDFSIVAGESIYYEIVHGSYSCDSIMEYHLDSLSYLVDNTDTLRVQHFTVYNPYNSSNYSTRVIERIGNLNHFEITKDHLKYCVFDMSSESLCSFNDSNTFLPSSVESQCNEIISSVEEDYNEFKIFPNPTNDLVFIESQKDVQSIMVKDISGTQLLQSTNSNSIDLRGLPNGIYFIQVSSDSHNSTFRVVKN